LFFVFGLVIVLLFSEYRFFIHQSEKLVELQEEYRNNLIIIRRAVYDIQQQEKSETPKMELVADEKKKSFITVNRKPEYLKKSLLQYLKEKKLENKLKEIQRLYKSKEGLLVTKKQNLRLRRITRQRLASAKRNFENRKNVRLLLPLLKRKQLQYDFDIIWPLDNFWLSSFFGMRKVPHGGFSRHTGIDMAAPKGEPVKAVAEGRVIEATFNRGYGRTVLIEHNSKYRTRYGHLNSIKVHLGDMVIKGQRIGTVGATGNVRGKNPDHLHFEVHVYGKQINPLYVLK
jgi:murein DD-endopeptidase MepM/ murein hydrolase activator NlpD